LIKKWREECVLFLDDCFSSDTAVATLSPHFSVETFQQWFRTEANSRKQKVKDPSIIRFCHEKKWLLVTSDREMRKTHVEEIKAHPHITILATAHNSNTPQEHLQWICAIIKLKPAILRHYKKSNRPWFATFSREGHITSFCTITPDKTTRRNRPRETQEIAAL
jgi:hypothetical protein